MATAKDSKEKPAEKSAAKKDDKPMTPATPLPFDVKTLSDEQLAATVQAAEAVIAERRTKKQEDFLHSIREQAQKLGLDPATIAALLAGRTRARRGSSDKRGTVAPKYRNPANAAQTWAGRGVKPAWIELGPDKKPLAKFRIPDAAK